MKTHGRSYLVAIATLAGVSLLLFLALALAACGGSDATSSTSPTTTPTQAAASPSVEASDGPTPLPAPTVAGTIAFQMTDADNDDIYVVRADGTGLKRLTDSSGLDEHPSWSPDGSKIVYAKYSHGSGDADFATIWVMNADGSGQRQLTKASAAVEPAWSPDGGQIAFMRYLNPEESSIWVVNADGSGLKRVTRPVDLGPVVASEFFPSWAPNGKILFFRLGDVWAVRPDKSGLVQLTERRDVIDYSLSPDGKDLAILSSNSDGIEIVPVRGGAAAVTLLSPLTDFFSAKHVATGWSPDGRALALAKGSFYGGDSSPLYVINADGSGLSAVPGIDKASNPSWRPE